MPLSPDMLSPQTPQKQDLQATKTEKELMAKAWKCRVTRQSDYRQALREFLSCSFIQYGTQTEFISDEERKLASSIIDKIEQSKGSSVYSDSLRELIQQ